MRKHHADVQHVSGDRLNAAQIAELMAIADLRRDATESERTEAVNSLLREYRLQIAEYRRGKRSVIDPLLLQGIGSWGRRIFAEATPVPALARFLGKQKRGKRASPERAARNISVTLAVIDLMNRGTTLEEAAVLVAADYTPRKVGKKLSLKADSVRKIYIRNETEQRARLAMNALEGLPPDTDRSTNSRSPSR
jgi:hypothetical protein